MRRELPAAGRHSAKLVVAAALLFAACSDGGSGGADGGGGSASAGAGGRGGTSAGGRGGAGGNAGAAGTGGGVAGTGGTSGAVGAGGTGGATGGSGGGGRGGTTGSAGTGGSAGAAGTAGRGGAGGATGTGAAGRGGTGGGGGAGGGKAGTGGGAGQKGGCGTMDCSDTQFCDWQSNRCGGGTLPVGMCMARPQGCTAVVDQVCGCDGQVYSNPCMAAVAGQDLDETGAGCKPPSGTFVCGPRFCAHGSQYCEARIGGPAGAAGNYGCLTLPVGCGANPTCACLTGTAQCGNCQMSTDGDLTTRCLLP